MFWALLLRSWFCCNFWSSTLRSTFTAWTTNNTKNHRCTVGKEWTDSSNTLTISIWIFVVVKASKKMNHCSKISFFQSWKYSNTSNSNCLKTMNEFTDRNKILIFLLLRRCRFQYFWTNPYMCRIYYLNANGWHIFKEIYRKDG